MKASTGLVLAICLGAVTTAGAQTASNSAPGAEPAPQAPAQKPEAAPTAGDYADALMNMDCETCEGEVKSLRGFSLAAPLTNRPAAAPAPQRPATASQPAVSRANTAPSRTTAVAVAKPKVSAGDLMITFQRGSADLTDQGAANARSFAGALKDPRLSSLSFLIIGHTDATGSPDRNLVLSQQRADAVKDFLVKQGVDSARLQTKGLGSGQLAVPSEPGASANRRVEVKRVS